MCRICERWEDPYGHAGGAGGAGGVAPAPLASPGTELLSPSAPNAHPPQHHQQGDAATTLRWSAPEVAGEERAGPPQTASPQGAAGRTRETAISLGNLNGATTYRTRSGSVSREDSVFYRFTLSSPRRLRIELRNLSADADLFLLNAVGTQIAVSELDGTLVDSLLRDLEAGSYYIRVDAFSSRAVEYQLRYRTETIARTPETAISLGDLTGVTAFRVRRATLLNPTFTNVNPVYFRFTLREARTIRVEMRDLAGNLLNGNERLSLLDSLGDERRISANRYGEELHGEDTLVQWLVAGTYYLRVNSHGGQTADFQLRSRTEPTTGARGATFGTAWYLGDLTGAYAYRTRSGTAREEVRGRGGDYRRFKLTRWRVVRFTLRNLSRAGLVRTSLLDLYGGSISDVRAGDDRGYYAENSLVRELRPGTYFIHVDDLVIGGVRNPRYQLRYRREPTPPRGTTHATAWYIGNLTRISRKYRNKYATVHQGHRYDEIDTDYRRFTLNETRNIRVELRRLSFTVDDEFFAGLVLGVEDEHGRQVGGGQSNTSIATNAIDEVRLGPGTYYIRVSGYHLKGKDETIRYHLRYLTRAATGTPARPPWRDQPMSAGPAPGLDESRLLAGAGGMLSG